MPCFYTRRSLPAIAMHAGVEAARCAWRVAGGSAFSAVNRKMVNSYDSPFEALIQGALDDYCFQTAFREA